MRRSKRPPPWSQLSTAANFAVLARANEPAVREAIDRANDLGWNYEDCGYHAAPLELTRDQFWLLVKLARTVGREAVPLVDRSGEPFTYRLPPAARRVLHLADKEMAGSIGAGTPGLDSDESRNRYVLRSLSEEAIASSRLEGANVTREDARRLLRERRAPRTEGERMVRNNYDTILMLRKRRSEPMTPDLLCEIQGLLTRDTLKKPDQAGRFRRGDEDISIWDDRENKVVYVPPPAEELPRRVARLCEFANAADDPSEPGRFTHPVVRAIALHFWVGYDHPFADGNGRTARALFYWSMLRNGYWLAEYLTISEVIRRQPVRYGRAYLDSENDDNDLTYFVLYHLGVIERSLREFREYLARKLTERAALAATVSAAQFNPRQREVMARGLRDPAAAFTYDSHAREHSVTVPTARADLLALERLGLLRGNRVGRRYEFVPAANLDRLLRELDRAGQSP